MSQLQALLNGIKHLEVVDLSPLGGPTEVMVRPLSSPEAGQVEAIRMATLKSQVEMTGASAQAHPIIEDMGAFLAKQREAKTYAVSCGLSHSDETCTVKDAGLLPSTWIDALAEVVYRISGLESTDDSFRVDAGMDGVGENGRNDLVAPFPSWSPPGGEPAGVDAPPA